MYRLTIKRRAERDMRGLPPAMFQRIHQAIRSLEKDPYPPGSRKLVGEIVGWRIRVGDYRVLYQVDCEGREVTIVRVRHRRDVYRF